MLKLTEPGKYIQEPLLMNLLITFTENGVLDKLPFFVVTAAKTSNALTPHSNKKAVSLFLIQLHIMYLC